MLRTQSTRQLRQPKVLLRIASKEVDLGFGLSQGTSHAFDVMCEGTESFDGSALYIEYINLVVGIVPLPVVDRTLTHMSV